MISQFVCKCWFEFRHDIVISKELWSKVNISQSWVKWATLCIDEMYKLISGPIQDHYQPRVETWSIQLSLEKVFKKSGVVNKINIPSIAYMHGHVFFKQGKFIFDGSGGNINFQGTIKPNWKKNPQVQLKH